MVSFHWQNAAILSCDASSLRQTDLIPSVHNFITSANNISVIDYLLSLLAIIQRMHNE